MLFDVVKRTHLGRADFRESEFDFLNRSARPEAEVARAQIEDLLSRYPTEGMDHLLSRFRSDDQNFHGALLELVLYNVFANLGCQVELCDLDETQKLPDFLVTADGSSCYVEATVADPTKGTLELNAHEKDAIQKLNELDGRGLGLVVRTKGTLTRPLNKRRVTRPFQKLIDDNDVDQIKQLIHRNDSGPRPFATLKVDDWKMIGSLTVTEGGDFVCSSTGEGKFIDPGKHIEKNVVDKAGYYGTLVYPFTIALNVREIGFDIKGHAMDAFFGKNVLEETIDQSTTPPRTIKHEIVRYPGGVWNYRDARPRYTRLKAVILFKRLDPFNLEVPMMVYFNPYVDVDELPDVLRTLPHAIGRDGEIEFVDGKGLGCMLFG